MRLSPIAIPLAAILVFGAAAASAQEVERSVTLNGTTSSLDIVRVFLIAQADEGFEGLAGKHTAVDAGTLAELKMQSNALREAVTRNGAELDRVLCNEGAVLLGSTQEFDALYVGAFRKLDRANNAATARVLDELSAAAYAFLVDELASISFSRSGSPVESGPPNPDRAVHLSCGRLAK